MKSLIAHVLELFSLTFFVFKKLLDQNDDIEEMFSRLEDCEEKLSQCEEKPAQLEK